MRWWWSIPGLWRLHVVAGVLGLISIAVLAAAEFIEPRYEGDRTKHHRIKSTARWSLGFLALFEIVAFALSLRLDTVRDAEQANQPVLYATATVEARLRWPTGGNPSWSGQYTGDTGYIAFVSEEKPILILRSLRGSARHTTDDEVVSVDYFDLTSPAAQGGAPLSMLRRCDFMKLKLPLLSEPVGILAGSLTYTLNSLSRVTLAIPAQQSDNGTAVVYCSRGAER